MGWLLLVFVRFGRGTLAAFRDRESRPLVVAVLLLLAAGTIVYNQLEGWSLLDSLYFTVVSLTTVGYGDLAPRGGQDIHHDLPHQRSEPPARVYQLGRTTRFLSPASTPHAWPRARSIRRRPSKGG